VTVLKYYKEVARPSEDPADRASLFATTAKVRAFSLFFHISSTEKLIVSFSFRQLEKLLAELDNEQDCS